MEHRVLDAIPDFPELRGRWLPPIVEYWPPGAPDREHPHILVFYDPESERYYVFAENYPREGVGGIAVSTADDVAEFILGLIRYDYDGVYVLGVEGLEPLVKRMLRMIGVDYDIYPADLAFDTVVDVVSGALRLDDIGGLRNGAARMNSLIAYDLDELVDAVRNFAKKNKDLILKAAGLERQEYDEVEIAVGYIPHPDGIKVRGAGSYWVFISITVADPYNDTLRVIHKPITEFPDLVRELRRERILRTARSRRSVRA